MPALSLHRQEALRARFAAMRPGWRPSSQVYEDLVASRLADCVAVLDLGCGRGGVLERLYGQARFAAGADPDARSLREHRKPALALTAAPAERLPFASGSFDLVVCSWVLEHLSQPDHALAEVARILCPRGSFLFLTPNSHNPLVAINRIISRVQSRWVTKLYDRSEADTFPVVYQANTRRRIDKIAQRVGLLSRGVTAVGDPTYLGFSEHLFRVACVLERMAPPSLKVHMVGEYAKA